MSDVKVEVPIVQAGQFFHLSPSQFIVTGPTSDGALQLLLCDDFIEHPLMSVTGDQSSEGVVSNLTLSFEGSNVRVAYGRVRLSLQHAAQLRDLLDTHIKQFEAVVNQAKDP